MHATKIIPEPDRRRHYRLRIMVPGRFMLPDYSEHPCETVDISPGGIMIKSVVAPYKGQRIIAYFSELGRVEGTVARVLRDRFAISVTSTLRKLDNTAATLTWLGNREDLGLPENRKSERINLTHSMIKLTFPDGRSTPARILDASMNGAALATSVTISPDIRFKVGGRPARVTRVMSGGYAVAFALPISAHEWHKDHPLTCRTDPQICAAANV